MDLKLEQRFVEWNRPFVTGQVESAKLIALFSKTIWFVAWSSIHEQKRCFVNEKFVWWNLKSTLIKQKKLTLVEEWLWSLLQVKLLIISKWVAPNKTARSQTGYVKVFLTCDVNQVTNIKIIWKLFELETRQLITRPCDIMLLLDAI